VYSPSDSRKQRAFDDESYDSLGGRAEHAIDSEQSSSESKSSETLDSSVEIQRVENGYTIEPGANLADADLSGADLTYAELYDANLTNADLANADWSNALLTGAV